MRLWCGCVAVSALLVVGLGGCLTVPDDVRAQFDAPDGQRPNNFGVGEQRSGGLVVRPDNPTVAWQEPAGEDAGFLRAGTAAEGASSDSGDGDGAAPDEAGDAGGAS
jgi:hypothetical protein